MEPLPLFISTIKFELGVMSLLFTAKTFKNKYDDPQEYQGTRCTAHDEDFETKDEKMAREKGGKL